VSTEVVEVLHLGRNNEEAYLARTTALISGEKMCALVANEPAVLGQRDISQHSRHNGMSFHYPLSIVEHWYIGILRIIGITDGFLIEFNIGVRRRLPVLIDLLVANNATARIPQTS
jgi:hypothetical protein